MKRTTRRGIEVLAGGLLLAAALSWPWGQQGSEPTDSIIGEEAEPRLAPARDAEATSRAVALAAASVDQLRSQLAGALGEALQQGPESALDVCRSEAPRIAAAVATGDLRLGRTSERVRNPANAPPPWTQPLLAELRDTRATEPLRAGPRSVPLGDGAIGYVEPIYVQPPCLTCHGAEIAPDVRRRIAALYPEDRAVGYRLGEFRGLFWAEVGE